jgi:DNA-binding winged helix-turn-helix (wHTH) protein/tetratricopeptide (TPR) repeat protein
LDSDFQLGDWTIHLQLNEVSAGPERRRVEPRVMQVLACLAAHAGKVVPKDQLLREVWGESFVTDEVLTNAVWELRHVLGDEARNPRFIQTVPRRGYRLIAQPRPEVLVAAPADPGKPAPDAGPMAGAVPAVPVAHGAPAAVPSPPGTVPGKRRRQALPRPRLARLLIGLGTFGALAAVALIVGMRRELHRIEPIPRMPLLVAGFTCDSADRDLSRRSLGIPDMLIQSLNQSPYLEIVSLDRTLGSGSGISAAAARSDDELGRRSGAKVIVRGSVVTRGGGSFRVLAQLRQVASEGLSKVSKVEEVEVSNADALPAGVDRLARLLRRDLEIVASGSPDEGHIVRSGTDSIDAFKEFVQGREDLERRYYKEAIAHLKNATRKDPRFAHAHELLASAYDALSEDELARDAIQSAARFSDELPEEERYWILLRRDRLEGDLKAELKDLKHFALVQPDVADWPFHLGFYYLTHQRACDEAVSQYRTAIQLEPKRHIFYSYLGEALLMCGRRVEALETLERLRGLGLDDAPTHERLGSAFSLTGNYDAALRELQEALRIKPDFVWALVELGDLYLAQGMVRSATGEFDLAESQARGHGEEVMVLLRKARMSMELGHLTAAVAAADQALVLKPGMLQAYWLRGLAEVLAGRPEAADRTAELMASRLTASGSRYLEDLWHHLRARLCLARHDQAGAVRELGRALALRSEEQNLFRNDLASVYLAQADLRLAAQVCKEALALNPMDARAHLILGRIDEAERAPGRAADEYQKVLAIFGHADTELAELVEARQRIRLLAPRRAAAH